MEKYFEEIEYDLSIKNPTSRVLDLWKEWTTIATKFDLHETLEDPKGKKQYREQIIKKLKPAALRKKITESFKWIGAKGRALRDENLEFYKKVKQAAIEQEKSKDSIRRFAVRNRAQGQELQEKTIWERMGMLGLWRKGTPPV